MIGGREIEILHILNMIKKEKGLDFVFQNVLELEDEKNFFVTDSVEMKGLLENVLGMKFIDNVARRKGLIMRKQIVPLLKEKLEASALSPC